MIFPVQLPYFAHSIPHCLPTIPEIEEAPVLSRTPGRTVAQVGAHFAVKFGTQIDLIEGENMLFVQQATTIRIPQVYALYSDAETSTNYIVMEYIDGDSLATKWPVLTATEKQEIASTLKRYYDELRTLPSPGYFGSIGKRYFLEGVFWSSEGNTAISGPFTTEAALNEAMALKYISESPQRTVHKADFYRRSLARVFQGHESKFTHADFQRKNVMVRRVLTDNDTTDGGGGGGSVGSRLEVTLIDWEKSGWYPSYWEYSMAVFATRWDDDWDEYVAQVLEPFNAEFPWLRMLYLELWS